MIIDKKKIVKLLLEEKQEEIYNILIITKKKIQSVNDVKLKKKKFFEVIINGCLNYSRQKYWEFLRINYNQFSCMFSLVTINKYQTIVEMMRK